LLRGVCHGHPSLTKRRAKKAASLAVPKMNRFVSSCLN
jgi:hypothetical protein